MPEGRLVCTSMLSMWLVIQQEIDEPLCVRTLAVQ